MVTLRTTAVAAVGTSTCRSVLEPGGRNPAATPVPSRVSMIRVGSRATYAGAPGSVGGWAAGVGVSGMGGIGGGGVGVAGVGVGGGGDDGVGGSGGGPALLASILVANSDVLPFGVRVVAVTVAPHPAD